MPQRYAMMAELRDWADALMQRDPDFLIHGNGDEVYLRRWWVVPRNERCNVYLHEIVHSDDERALHDHPWPNTSMLISGCYVEHTPGGQFLRTAGDVVERQAEALHRLEILPGKRAVSLFMTGPKVREWGFSCPKGWVPWQEFCSPLDKGQIGRGCGEGEG